jgi:hypothetical protein
VTNPKSRIENPKSVAIALAKIGIAQPTWKTLVIAAAQEANVPAPLLWEIWARLEDWPAWSAPLHQAARWTGTPGWTPGATFEQTLNLGFPLGQTTSTETVGAVGEPSGPGRQVMWWKDEKGIRSCHIWEFEALTPDRTRVANLEVFHGTPIGLLKLLVAQNWQRRFEQSVAGLIRAAAQS